MLDIAKIFRELWENLTNPEANPNNRQTKFVAGVYPYVCGICGNVSYTRLGSAFHQVSYCGPKEGDGQQN